MNALNYDEPTCTCTDCGLTEIPDNMFHCADGLWRCLECFDESQHEEDPVEPVCEYCNGEGEVIVNGWETENCPECHEGPDPDRFYDARIDRM